MTATRIIEKYYWTKETIPGPTLGRVRLHAWRTALDAGTAVRVPPYGDGAHCVISAFAVSKIVDRQVSVTCHTEKSDGAARSMTLLAFRHMTERERAAELETAIRAALPKYLAPERVQVVFEKGYRVLLDRRLVWSYGYGSLGWMRVEMGQGAGTSRELAAIERATKRAMRPAD